MSNNEYLESFRKYCKQVAKGKEPINAYLNKRLDIENSIADMIDGFESMIIHMRYIQLKTWKEICDYFSYSRSQILRVHRSALKNFVLNEVGCYEKP